MEAPKSTPPQTKAGDWRSYERVILPPVRDLHLLDVALQNGAYSALEKVLKEGWGRKKLVDEVKASGLRGRGGAGFSTGLKWSFMPPDVPGQPRYLACNGDESEPGTFKDRQIFEYNPHLLFEGMMLGAYGIGAHVAYLYVRGEYARYIEHMERELAKAYAKGLVGKNLFGTGWDCEIVIHKGAGAYICGEESSLMESLEGKRAYPRIKPPFPAQKGLWAKPTTINNVESLACVPLIVNRGASWFAGLGAPKHPGPILYGLSGHLNRPGVYEYPTGMLLTDLIYEVGGGIRGGKRLKAVVPGGSSVPILTAEMCEGVTMDAESMRDAGSMLGTAGVLVMDEDVDIVSFIRRTTHFYHHESCGQCTPCREGTGWLEKIVTRIDEGEGNLRDLDLLISICDGMEGRTICALADAAAWPVRWSIKRFRAEFEAKCRPSLVTTGIVVSGDGGAQDAVAVIR